MQTLSFYNYIATVIKMLSGWSSSSSDLIPREVIYGEDIDVRSIDISPNAAWISYQASNGNGSDTVWIRPASNQPGSGDRMLSISPPKPVSSYAWTRDSQNILYTAGWTQLYKINVATGQSTPLTPDNATANLLAQSYERLDTIVVGIKEAGAQSFDVYSLNLNTGARQLMYKNDQGFGVDTFLCDNQLNLRLAWKMQPDASKQYYHRAPNSNQWIPYRILTPELGNDLYGRPLTFDLTGQKVYWLDNQGRDKLSLVLLDVTSNSTSNMQVIYEPKQADLVDVTFHPTTRIPQIAVENYLRRVNVPLNAAITTQLGILAQKIPGCGELSVLATSSDMQNWIVRYQSDISPPTYYLYSIPASRVTFLAQIRKSLLNYKLARSYPVEIKTRDGLVDVCYLTIPTIFDVFGTGKPTVPIPMAIFIHGGPNNREPWGYNEQVPMPSWRLAQLMANRGYAFLICNYRGSTGFGRQHAMAGNGEIGKAMQNDITDAVNWAIAQNIADPTKVAIIGGSYGGYSTLAGVVWTPELYQCGMDMFGMADLVLSELPVPDFMEAQEKIRLGVDWKTEAGKQMLLSRSPLYFTDKIRVPMLVAHGMLDTNVPKNNSDQLVAKLKAQGTPVIYLVMPDEPHGFFSDANNIAMSAVAERFLDKCLGGRVEPLKDALQKSKMQVIEGPI